MNMWRRVTCFFKGCLMGAWLPTVSPEAGMHSFLRQCTRCRRFDYRLRRVSEGPPP